MFTFIESIYLKCISLFSENRPDAADYLVFVTDGRPTQMINGTRVEEGEVGAMTDALYREVRMKVGRGN